jgi:hypothetical protein
MFMVILINYHELVCATREPTVAVEYYTKNTQYSGDPTG